MTEQGADSRMMSHCGIHSRFLFPSPSSLLHTAISLPRSRTPHTRSNSPNRTSLSCVLFLEPPVPCKLSNLTPSGNVGPSSHSAAVRLSRAASRLRREPPLGPSSTSVPPPNLHAGTAYMGTKPDQIRSPQLRTMCVDGYGTFMSLALHNRKIRAPKRPNDVHHSAAAAKRDAASSAGSGRTMGPPRPFSQSPMPGRRQIREISPCSLS